MHCKQWILALALAVGAVCAWADDACASGAAPPTQAQLEAAQRNTRDRGLLWRVTKDGRSSFLYGTIHAAKLDWAFPGPALLQAVAQSDRIALELDLSDADTARQMAEASAATGTPTLAPALIERMQRQAQESCLPWSALAALRPEFQIATLNIVAARSSGLNAAYGTDTMLAVLAQRAGTPVEALETVDEQLRALLTVDTGEAIAAVEEGLADLESGKAQAMLARLAQAWADRDEATLANYRDWCECVQSAADRAALKRLLDDRNPLLAERIDRLHARGLRVLAAVGALHMTGPLGLPTLLAQRGYKVEKVF